MASVAPISASRGGGLCFCIMDSRRIVRRRKGVVMEKVYEFGFRGLGFRV